MNYTDMQPGDLVVFDFDAAPDDVSAEWIGDCKAAMENAHGVFSIDNCGGVPIGGVWYVGAWFRPAPIEPGMSVRLVDADDLGGSWKSEIESLTDSWAPLVVSRVSTCGKGMFLSEDGPLFSKIRFRPVAPGTKVRHALPGADPAEALSANVQRGAVSAEAPDPSALRDAEAIARQDAPAATGPGPVEFTDPVTGQRLLRYPPEVMRTHSGDEWVWVHTRGVR